MKSHEQLIKNNIPIKITTWITYLIKIGANATCDNITIKWHEYWEILDSYPNLFASHGYNFFIWGVIYVLSSF